MAKRHAAEMGADADDDEPFGFLDARSVGRGVAQLAQRHRAGSLDFLRRPVSDEDRLAAPFDGDDLAFGDIAEIDFRRARSKVDASGFIWSIKGQTAPTAATAPAAPVAMKRKSRRVGSPSVVVATSQVPRNAIVFVRFGARSAATTWDRGGRRNIKSKLQCTAMRLFANLDHDDFELNRSKIMNVIDSNNVKRDRQISSRNLRELICTGKPVLPFSSSRSGSAIAGLWTGVK